MLFEQEILSICEISIINFVKSLFFNFKSLTLLRTSEFFSCLFVKFVLYTAGFLGEGTLLIFIRYFEVWSKCGAFWLIMSFFFVTWARFTDNDNY